MEELVVVISKFGETALWGIVIYKSLDLLGGIAIFYMIYLGIKKAWPHIKDIL